jgi:hypothetical protein
MRHITGKRRFARHALAGAIAAAALCAGPLAAGAPAAPAHGHVIQVAPPGLGSAGTSQSTNWFGYNRGALQPGAAKQYHSVTGDWTVPAASQHSADRAEYSSTWIGIGGGCIDSTCAVVDPTLIQTGTEQDVDRNGNPSYFAWWELIPAPGLRISRVSVHPGDQMHAKIAEILFPGSELWRITLQNRTTGETFTKTVPYTSTHTTVEWIEETPLVIGLTLLAPLPDLTDTAFDNATANGRPANLKPSERVELIDNKGNVIGTPSAPDAEADGFGLCAWATTCPVP